MAAAPERFLPLDRQSRAIRLQLFGSCAPAGHLGILPLSRQIGLPQPRRAIHAVWHRATGGPLGRSSSASLSASP